MLSRSSLGLVRYNKASMICAMTSNLGLSSSSRISSVARKPFNHHHYSTSMASPSFQYNGNINSSSSSLFCRMMSTSIIKSNINNSMNMNHMKLRLDSLRNNNHNTMGNLIVRHMNRNARRPKKANHGKRPCSRMRRRLKAQTIKSRRIRIRDNIKLWGFSL